MIALIGTGRIIPVAVINRVDDGLRLAAVLLENKIPIIEITLRTAAAFEVIKAIKKEFPEMLTGAGSVLDTDSLKRAADSGAAFGVAPCLDLDVVETAAELNFPFVPGASTPTELSTALKTSNVVKIFPASNLGGPDYIKAISSPFAMKNFKLIPTGGINEKNFTEYLAIDRVAACGMTWIADQKLIESGGFDELDRRMKITVALIP